MSKHKHLQMHSDGMKNENYLATTEGVRVFLEDLGLVQYYDMFIIKGFDSEEDICHITEDNLESMMITDPYHRQMILQAAAQHRPSEQYHVFDWLRRNGLDHYYINFIQSEYTTLKDISSLDMDESVFDELEITLPGHKRRLERAVNELRKRKRIEGPIEEPLAFGRWAKPECLSDGKFEFLVVDATIYSTNDTDNAQAIEFMVDSGSDVTTIRQEVLDMLNLEMIGRIHSKGVHGSKTTNLYKAKLLIGNQEMEIEVMGESYDSLGSRVVRHFRHYIDGVHHVWLRGNYSDENTLLRQTTHVPALATTSSKQVLMSSSMQNALLASSSSSSSSSSSKSSSSSLTLLSKRSTSNTDQENSHSLLDKDTVLPSNNNSASQKIIKANPCVQHSSKRKFEAAFLNTSADDLDS